MKKRWVLILGLISFVGITGLPPSSSYGQKIWHKEVVDSSSQLRVGDVIIKISPKNIPVISYSEPNQDGHLETRLKEEGEWKRIVTDPSLIYISGLSMAIDSNENLHFGLIRQDQVTRQWRPI